MTRRAAVAVAALLAIACQDSADLDRERFVRALLATPRVPACGVWYGNPSDPASPIYPWDLWAGYSSELRYAGLATMARMELWDDGGERAGTLYLGTARDGSGGARCGTAIIPIGRWSRVGNVVSWASVDSAGAEGLFDFSGTIGPTCRETYSGGAQCIRSDETAYSWALDGILTDRRSVRPSGCAAQLAISIRPIGREGLPCADTAE